MLNIGSSSNVEMFIIIIISLLTVFNSVKHKYNVKI